MDHMELSHSLESRVVTGGRGMKSSMIRRCSVSATKLAGEESRVALRIPPRSRAVASAKNIVLR